MDKKHRTLEETLKKMNEASARFYSASIATECHAFIEFTGLMNEYIKTCEAMHASGDDSWLHANTHSKTPLAFEPFQLAYLAEKLDCIYGASLRTSPQLKAAFEGHP